LGFFFAVFRINYISVHIKYFLKLTLLKSLIKITSPSCSDISSLMMRFWREGRATCHSHEIHQWKTTIIKSSNHFPMDKKKFQAYIVSCYRSGSLVYTSQ